jgi:aryl-alcohol dehydrogenase-like predicted oxidoreductase
MLKHAIEAVHAALDGGINWIDTAAVYGLGPFRRSGGARARRPLQSALRFHKV